jgi:Caspase domain/Trypsin-like peptidase domain
VARHAIVIGIDKYANNDWSLRASVKDALRFVDWALDRGEVEPGNLRLFLSSKDPPPNTRVPYKDARSRTIRSAIQAFMDGAGAGAERLYFYFGGHGLSAPGVRKEPVLIPADVKELPLDANLLLGFSEVITALGRSEPDEQFFFLDACRDFGLENFEPALGSAVGPWTPPREDDARTRQFVLYATAPGERAYEQQALGKGVFTSALIEVLEGNHPVAAPWIYGRRAYVVSFGKLAEQVRELVKARLENVPGAERYVQLPESLSMRAGDAILTSFSGLPKVSIYVQLSPSAARKRCRVHLLNYPPGNVAGQSFRRRGPPIEVPTTFRLSPGDYGLLATSQGYSEYREPFDAHASRDIEIRLLKLDDAPAPAVAVNSPGALLVTSEDPTAEIVVRDGERKVRTRGHGRVAMDLAPALYRIQLITVEGETVEEQAVVRAGEETSVSLTAPSHGIGSDQIDMLAELGIHSDEDGYLHASKHLGGVASARLASVLAFAAYAAHRPDERDFARLRKVGVRSFAKLRRGKAALLLIVGASGERPARDVSRERFLAEGEVVVRDLEGTTLGVGGFELLPKLATAAQSSLECTPGCVTVELRLPGLAPTRYALTALPNRVTVVIAVASDDGDVEVQQYLLPVRPSAGDYLSAAPENIRRLEVAQRYYAKERVVPQDDALKALLGGKFLDPLLGALAGYALVHSGRQEEYRRRALRNMLRRFGRLPDSHVLAGLCEPEDRDKHFTAALELGLPVFADGFRALHEWFTEREREVDRPIWVQPSLLLSGSPWTAWVASRPLLQVREGSFEPAPVGWDALEDQRRRIERTARSVGRIVPRDGSFPLVATAFLVAPRIAMTMSIALEGRAASDFVIDFGDGNGASPLEFEVKEVLGVGEPETPTELVALVRLAGTSRGARKRLPPPLSVATSFDGRVEGRPVYAVGFPVGDARAPEDVQQRLGGKVGAKWVQPGQLLATAGTTFYHDCLTLPGSGGSPVVDLETGLVIGFHFAGLWLDFKRGEAVALWTVRNDPLLASAAIRSE